MSRENDLKIKKMKHLIYLLSICFFLTSCNNNNKTVNMEKATQEANAFIENQLNFFTKNSLELAKSTFADDAVLIGTDAAEYHVGWSEIETPLKAQLATIKNAQFTYRNLKVVMSDDGNMASYTQKSDFAFVVDDKPGEIKDLRLSGVIKKINGEWKTVQIHFSIGGNGQAVEYEITK